MMTKSLVSFVSRSRGTEPEIEPEPEKKEQSFFVYNCELSELSGIYEVRIVQEIDTHTSTGFLTEQIISIIISS